MPERYSGHETEDEQGILEKRLGAYYGPVLPEQPLPTSSWLRLSSQLPPRHPVRRWQRPKWRFRRRRASPVLPFDIQERLARIAFQADLLDVARRVECTFKPRVDIPFVSVSLLKKRAIRLILPTQRGLTLSQAELDVLVASGLARYKCIHRTTYTVTRLVLSALLLLLLLAVAFILVCWRSVPIRVAFSLLGSVAVLSIAAFWLLSSHARQIARQADFLVVQWIGREQTCRGLHALAARSHAPAHKKWGDLSLDERIHTICHTPAAVEDERFTLVR